jgi:RimJ/RimL family protein N-acetyltransferase
VSDVTWPRRTARLAIRPATEEDLPGIFEYRRLPEVAEWLPRHPRTFESWLLTLDARGMLGSTFVVERDGVPVGDLYLRVEDAWAQAEVAEQAKGKQAEIGWILDPAHQGQGYASEAVRALLAHCFEDLGLHRVTAICFTDNEASWRLMERVGMRRESHSVRESLHRSRGWLDSYTYALLEDEWTG